MSKDHIMVEGRFVMRALFKRRGAWAARARDLLTGEVFQRTARAPKKEDARREIMRHLRELAKLAPGDQAVQEVFSVAFEDWLRHRTCRASTVATYRQLYEGGFKAPLGGLYVHQVEFRDIQEFITQRRERGNSPSTIGLYLRILRMFFQWAIQMRYADGDPTKGIRLQGPRKDAGRALTMAEAHRLLEAALGRGAVHLGLLIAFYTGLRRGNIFGMTWGHVDLEAGQISFPAEEMKAGREHTIPIHLVLNRALRDRLRRLDVVDMKARILGPARSFAAFKSAVAAAGLGELRWHDTRHSFASWMESRCTYSCLQELLAHAPHGTTMGYTHPSWSEKVTAISRLPDFLGDSGRLGIDKAQAAE